MTSLAIVGMEMRRFVRRLDTFWLLLLLAIPSAGILLAFPGTVRGPVPASTAARVFLWIEAAGIAGLTLYLSFRSTAQEIDDRTWILLRQAPRRLPPVFLGKALAIAGQSLFLHAFCILAPLALLADSPREIAEALLLPAVAWLFALGLIPEGMLMGLVHREQSARTYLLLRAGTIARLLGLLLALHVALDPALRAGGVTLAQPAVRLLLTFGPALHDPSASFRSPWAAPVFLLGWQLLTSIPFVALLLRRR